MNLQQERSPTDLPELSARMINKKYFHKYPGPRAKLLDPSGKLDENVFDFIHDQQQFNRAIKELQVTGAPSRTMRQGRGRTTSQLPELLISPEERLRQSLYMKLPSRAPGILAEPRKSVNDVKAL